MIRYKRVPILVAASGKCDRCARKLAQDSVEFHERTSIAYEAGYGSVFGDGNFVECDLCQHCIKELLGPWLKISPPEDAERHRVQRRDLLPDKFVLPVGFEIISPEESKQIEAAVAILKENTDETNRALDDVLSSIDASNQRMKKNDPKSKE
jgi:hypothetical protein